MIKRLEQKIAHAVAKDAAAKSILGDFVRANGRQDALGVVVVFGIDGLELVQGMYLPDAKRIWLFIDPVIPYLVGVQNVGEKFYAFF